MSKIEILILGTAQDGSIPHPNCFCLTCLKAINDKKFERLAVSLAIIDNELDNWFLVEATPKLDEQLIRVYNHTKKYSKLMDGIFLSHAHYGHYHGLAMLGKECINSKSIPTYVGSGMKKVLENDVPWKFLVDNNNVDLKVITDKNKVDISKNIKVTPIELPHRNEIAETFGFIIEGKEKKVLFIPDIDSWDEMEIPIEEYIKSVDIALLDATFFSKEEIIDMGRDYTKIPHPPIENTVRKLAEFTKEKDIYLIHFNHSNLILSDEDKFNYCLGNGFKIANENEIIEI